MVAHTPDDEPLAKVRNDRRVMLQSEKSYPLLTFRGYSSVYARLYVTIE